jgi:hypothetical protein
MLPDPPTFDATGTWVGLVTSNFSTPAGNEDQDTAAQVVVTQTGNDVTVSVVGDTVVYTGTVSGDSYEVSTTMVEPDGTTNETIAFTLTSANAGGGTISWSFAGTGGPLSGGAILDLTRATAAQFDATGTWTVTTSGNFSSPPGNEEPDGMMSVPVTQSGTTVQLMLDGELRSGFVSGADYFVEYDVDEGGGVETTIFIQFTLTSATAGTGSVLWRSENGSIVSGGANLVLATP